MGKRPRWWKKENVIYLEARRTVDRQFLLRPTSPEVRNIIGACAGRALKKFPVQLFRLEANINHIQVVRSTLENQLDNMSKFDQRLYYLLSRELNRLWDREGPVGPEQ